MEYKLKYLPLFIMIFNFAFSQKTESIKLENCIKKTVNEFFIEIGRIDKKELNNFHVVQIIEIRDIKVLGYNTFGIYRCTDSSSHSQNYILLKKDGKIKILNSKNSVKDIAEILKFLDDAKMNDDVKLDYLKLCVRLMDDNYHYIMDKKINEQDWVKCD